jgi:hypothetical protein
MERARPTRYERPAAAVLILMLSCLPGIWCSPLQAQQADETTVETITAVRTDNHPKIDGILDDACWAKAPRSGDFLQREPDDGEPATEATLVQVAYDDEALFVAMEMYDSEPAKIVSRLTRRDRDQDADFAYVAVDSYHDHQTAYMFLVYASGTQHDVHYFNDDWSDGSWDAVWASATKITDRGWTAEFKIPYDCLRFASSDDQVWGIRFGRAITRKQEENGWPHIPQSASGYVSNFAHLVNLTNLSPPKHLEILPYAVSYQETEAKHPGNPDGRDLSANAGVDFRYGVTPNITLNATLNPDFGQVEADEAVLNLTSFETFYPEKRPFFLEGLSIFDTYFDLFYSRRIGRAPSQRISDVAYYLDMPGATTILGAAKVTGKTSSGTSIGIIEAVTQRETAKYFSRDSTRKKSVVEPEANYFVARLKQDVLRNSTVGIMATATNQKTRHPAYTGCLDWILRFGNGYYATHGQIVGSSTGPDQRGWGGFTRIAKEGGEHLRANIDVQYTDRELDLNRLGYLRRNALRQVSGWFEYRTNKKWWIINRTWNAVYAELAENLDGLKQNYGCDIDVDVEFSNYWSIDTGGWVDFGRTAFDWETHGGPPVPIPLGQSWHFSFNTDPREWWGLNPSVGGGDTWDGRFNSWRLWVHLRPMSNVEMSLGPGYREERSVSRWLKAIVDEDGNRQDIFGEQYLRSFDMTLRGTFTFTKDLTLQLYAQPFVAAADYTNFKRLVPPDSYEYVDATVYDETVERPDFDWDSFNSNVILRWEYRPGSTLFLVWTQAREYKDNLGNFDFRRDIDALFDTVPGNTFLVKANYRLSM